MKKLALLTLLIALPLSTQASGYVYSEFRGEGLAVSVAMPIHNPYRGHHGHYGHRGHFGLYLGVPLWGPSFSYYSFPSPNYYSPDPYYFESRTPDYVEKNIRYRFYCPDPDGYFPNVRKCATRWEKEETAGPADGSAERDEPEESKP